MRTVEELRVALPADIAAAGTAAVDEGGYATVSDVVEHALREWRVGRERLAYAARDDLAPAIRVASHQRYLIVFRVLAGAGTVRIERVLHGARDRSRLLWATWTTPALNAPAKSG